MLNDDDLERYARQVIMPDMGEAGQEALLAGKVLVVGAGGLGAPAIFYLAAAGVGTITIIDMDNVSRTDLNRQIIYTTADVGMTKVARAAAAAAALNPDITIQSHAERLGMNNVDALLQAHDVVLDCSDNIETRFLLGDAAHRNAKPLVFGGAVRSEGQVAVFQSNCPGFEDTACFRCVFPEMPDASQAPGCSEAGILGPVTGIIGSMQALEAIKLLSGIGSSLTGRLQLFDGSHGSFMEITTARRQDCTFCGNQKAG
jgi:molybdopterin/thiamine biosynthesis adenylyltransferase